MSKTQTLQYSDRSVKPLQKKGMLLVLPVPFLIRDNQLFFESQACNGIERWADNFESVIVAAPTIPEALATQLCKNTAWRNTRTLVEPKRFELVPLPWAYKLRDFLSYYQSVRTTLTDLISRSDYLHFAIGGLVGDWASVGALEAQKQGRAYAIHTDRVEHKVILEETKTAKPKRRIKAIATSPLMAVYHRWIIQNCSLGLWHGKDCYSAYSSLCKNSYLIHNIHLKPSDRISNLDLSEKIKEVTTAETIRICYAGRIDPDKAPLDWVRAIGHARNLGVNLHATWMGDGSLLDEMKALIEQLDLNSHIELTGFEQNRVKLLKKIRQSHLMLFTHVTPESPRCLLESLVCGTPIIGYRSDYADDLVQDFGGGMFVPMKDWQKLGEILVSLSKERQRLSQLIQEAAKNGAKFNDEVVFRERSELIKKHLTDS